MQAWIWNAWNLEKARIGNSIAIFTSTSYKIAIFAQRVIVSLIDTGAIFFETWIQSSDQRGIILLQRGTSLGFRWRKHNAGKFTVEGMQCRWGGTMNWCHLKLSTTEMILPTSGTVATPACRQGTAWGEEKLRKIRKGWTKLRKII